MNNSTGSENEFLRHMYARPENLSSRMETHSKYGTNAVPFQDWVVSQVRWSGKERVLDVGCGTGSYCQGIMGRLDSGVYVGIDGSPAHIAAALNQNRTDEYRPIFEVADAHDLPFEAESFDVVFANHVLYHLDVDRAINELRRVVKASGILIAATNSEFNMPELDQLHRLALGTDRRSTSVFRSFSLESGGEKLRKAFVSISKHTYVDKLRFLEPDALVHYYASGWVYRNNDGSHDSNLPNEEKYRRCSRVAVEVQAQIEKFGYFDVHKKLGAFLATHPR